MLLITNGILALQPRGRLSLPLPDHLMFHLLLVSPHLPGLEWSPLLNLSPLLEQVDNLTGQALLRAMLLSLSREWDSRLLLV